jgi:hypothetical protein
MSINYDNLNNLPEISFEAGTQKILPFTVYKENGLDPQNIISAVWTLCPYGELQITTLTKTGTNIIINTFDIVLDSSDTETLSGKYIQQITVVDASGNTFRPGQGTVIISPAISES